MHGIADALRRAERDLPGDTSDDVGPSETSTTIGPSRPPRGRAPRRCRRGASAGPGAERRPARARLPQLDRATSQRVDRALRAKQDVWGTELLAAPGGPTYEGVRRVLTPLLFAGAPGQTAATESGVHYLALGQPDGARGADTVALHVADGSQILSNDIGGSRLTIGVGDRGAERYGACLSRLSTSRLADGWLPILDTAYTDSAGVRYRQESFVARVPQTRRSSASWRSGGARGLLSVEIDARRRQRGDRPRPSCSSTLSRRGGPAVIVLPIAPGTVRHRLRRPARPGAERADRGRSGDVRHGQAIRRRVLDAAASPREPGSRCPSSASWTHDGTCSSRT